MSYHDDLLRLASDLVNKDGATQADLRRAVSFSLARQRNHSQLERPGTDVDHGMRKRVSDRLAKITPFAGRRHSLEDSRAWGQQDHAQREAIVFELRRCGA